MTEAYIRLHEMGFASSIEVWNKNGNLVGGLYGVDIFPAFFGEYVLARTVSFKACTDFPCRLSEGEWRETY